ncbi:C-3',4' desaturase CrtD [Chamaesiphon sp. VAR_48_metabat_135_sub]|uniref:C-3',4' desaturase CrtD n=1 Tax=Chamaesiphon sp. VAR_48_metabat_135_sub TaxID=2964699 RepID=UPI00286A525A|nr:C-3',4' desaturase CrtD [Chamaesiphon sp. VAR_48_metabat_135_sub]
MSKSSPSKVIVIGAGIGGLTAGALLAKRGYEVIIFDRAIVPGGCASTFKRQGFTFDVGATQVAGLEPGGIHHRIFSELEIDLPAATPCDPACAVFLPGETTPINVWRDPVRWQAERQQQFPGSEPFWQFLQQLFNASWEFQSRDPILPPRNLWDVGQLVGALRLGTLITVPFTLSTVGDALKWFGLNRDKRLQTFLDLQLKLYSQVTAAETALLYAATALGVSQTPQGLYHLEGSMQVLSDRLVAALERDGGKLLMRHTVESIECDRDRAIGVTICNQKTGETWTETATEVVANVTAQDLVRLLGDAAPKSNPLPLLSLDSYRSRVKNLPQASGAFVLYLGVKDVAIPAECPPHLQFLYDYDGIIGENNSLFVSVSHPGDGRAPTGQATIIASSFVDPNRWYGQEVDYAALKAEYTATAIAKLGKYFDLSPENIIVTEVGTPRTFERYTGRERGIVGGIGQRVSTFGPFGFATRTPVARLWMVGDSTHPGEGTAGVSYSALTVVRQIEIG